MNELEYLKNQLDYIAGKLDQLELLDDEIIQNLTLMKRIMEKKYESEMGKVE